MPEIEPTLEIYCPECGYDLRSLPSEQCPECGMAIDRSRLGESIIPWVHRDVLGRLRAFWRTVEMLSLRPGTLHKEMSRPAGLADAIRFRRAVVLHALLPSAIVLTLAWKAAAGRIWYPSDIAGSVLQIASLFVGWFCLAALLWGMTGSASYLFRPKSLSTIRQNRAVALSYYACAPLAYLPFTALIAGIVVAFLEYRGDSLNLLLRAAFSLVGFIPLLSNLIMLIISPVGLLRALLPGETGQHWRLAAFLPSIWALWGAITLIGLPAAWLAVVVMILSLWK